MICEFHLRKNLLVIQETRVRSLGWEDPLEKGMTTQSSILAWQATVHRVSKSQTRLSDFHFSLHSPFILSRTEYWSGLSFPSPGDLPNPGIKPRSPILQSDSLPADPPGKALVGLKQHKRKVHIPWVFHLPSKNFPPSRSSYCKMAE